MTPMPDTERDSAAITALAEVIHSELCRPLPPSQAFRVCLDGGDQLDADVMLAALRADPAAARAVALSLLTEGDLAKALHDAHEVLRYWPDPRKIAGAWEMWGIALHAALGPKKEPTDA